MPGSLRKTCQYRTDQDERKDFHVYKNKSKDDSLKKKILPTLFEQAKTEETEEDHPDAEDASTVVKPAKKKRNRKKRKHAATEDVILSDNTIKKAKVDVEIAKEDNKPVDTNNTAVSNNKEENKTSVKKKKKKKKNKAGGPGSKEVLHIGKLAGIFEKSKKSQSTNNKKLDNSKSISDERLKAYGVNPNKFKRTLKKEFFKKAAADSK